MDRCRCNRHRIHRSQTTTSETGGFESARTHQWNRFALLLTHRWRPFIRNIRMPGIDRWLPRASSSVRVCALTTSHFILFYFYFFFPPFPILWRITIRIVFDEFHRWDRKWKVSLRRDLSVNGDETEIRHGSVRLMCFLKWIWWSVDDDDGLWRWYFFLNTWKFTARRNRCYWDSEFKTLWL